MRSRGGGDGEGGGDDNLTQDCRSTASVLRVPAIDGGDRMRARSECGGCESCHLGTVQGDRASESCSVIVESHRAGGQGGTGCRNGSREGHRDTKIRRVRAGDKRGGGGGK